MNGGFALLICFIPLILAIVHVVLGVWVYKDAKKRGEDELVWLIVFLVSGIIGLIIYLIVRPEKKRDEQQRYYYQNKYKK